MDTADAWALPSFSFSPLPLPPRTSELPPHPVENDNAQQLLRALRRAGVHRRRRRRRCRAHPPAHGDGWTYQPVPGPPSHRFPCTWRRRSRNCNQTLQPLAGLHSFPAAGAGVGVPPPQPQTVGYDATTKAQVKPGWAQVVLQSFSAAACGTPGCEACGRA